MAGVARWAVITAAVEAAATGVVLFIRPSLFARLVFDAEFSGAGQALGRLAAFALLALALTTWPTSRPTSYLASSVRALLIYNVLATIYLVYVGIGGVLTWNSPVAGGRAPHDPFASSRLAGAREAADE